MLRGGRNEGGTSGGPRPRLERSGSLDGATMEAQLAAVTRRSEAERAANKKLVVAMEEGRGGSARFGGWVQLEVLINLL